MTATNSPYYTEQQRLKKEQQKQLQRIQQHQGQVQVKNNVNIEPYIASHDSDKDSEDLDMANNYVNSSEDSNQVGESQEEGIENKPDLKANKKNNIENVESEDLDGLSGNSNESVESLKVSESSDTN